MKSKALVRKGLRYAPVCVLQELENGCWNLARPSASTLCHREPWLLPSFDLIIIKLIVAFEHTVFEYNIFKPQAPYFRASSPRNVRLVRASLPRPIPSNCRNAVRHTGTPSVFFWGLHQGFVFGAIGSQTTSYSNISNNIQTCLFPSPSSPSIYHLDLQDVAWAELLELDPVPSSSDSSASCLLFDCRLQSLWQSL